MRRTTLGRLLVDQALPEDLRDESRVLDKKGVADLLRKLAERHPDKYAEVSKTLSDIGRTVATEFGGYTFGLEHLRTSPVAVKIRAEIQKKVQRILADDDLTPQQRKDLIVKVVGGYQQRQIDDIYADARKANNPLALQVVSGSRGNQMNLASLLGSDLLYSDHRDEVIPLPVLSSYSQGLKPMEYWAATYGARRGTMATKFATQDAGFLCLAAGTLVRMADGSDKPIEHIEVGDIVCGGTAFGTVAATRVVRVFQNGRRACVRYTFEHSDRGEEQTITHLTCTPDHKVLRDCNDEVLPQDFVRGSAYALHPLRAWTVGDYGPPFDCVSATDWSCNGEHKLVAAEAAGEHETYDIEVEHPDHMFVLAAGVIVSNSKQLNQVAHRLMVVDEDDPRDIPHRGLPVDTDDADNEGALLAQDVGPYKRDTVLTPKILKHIKGLGHDRLLVRSPLVGGSPDGGVYARDVGVRERGTLPGRGEMVGLTAAQALSEPLSQGQLSAKHSGGVAGQEKAVGGFAYIDQLIQVPKRFKGGAAHAEHDGTVSAVEPAPAGGHYVWVGDKRHYVPADVELKVKKGDAVEAGDVLSEGFPNPAVVVEHKGVGEGKRYFVNAYREAARGAGIKANRRNVELLARGLINHVRLTDEFGDHVPDDVLPYSTVEQLYEPRAGHEVVAPDRALGKYLERPVLHYSVGTRVRPSVLKELRHFGVPDVAVHADPPPFQSTMVRGMYSLQHDPDPLTRMYGSGLKDSTLDAAHRGATSDQHGTSFVPSLARAVDFGRGGAVRQPEPGVRPPPEGQPFGDPRAPKPALDLPARRPAAPEPPRRPGLFAGLFKSSAELRAEAEALIKAAQQPRVTSTVEPNTGSSTGGQSPVSPTTAPGGLPAVRAGRPTDPAEPPSPILPRQAQPLPGIPAVSGWTPFAQRPQAAGPPAPAGQVHPARLPGLLGPDDDPRAAAQFVEGGGFGGDLGRVARLGSLFDVGAVSSLTGGRAAAPYGGGQADDLIGGDPAAGVRPPATPPAPPPPPAAPASAAPQPDAANVARRLMTNPYTSQLAFRLFGAGFKKVPILGWAYEAGDAALAPRQEVRDEAANPTWMTLAAPGRAVRGSAILLGEARDMHREGQEGTARASARRVADLQVTVSNLEQAAARRPLAPEEQAQLDRSREQMTRLRAEQGSNPQFDQAVQRRALPAATGSVVRRLQDGEQAAARVLAGQGSPADQEAFSYWLDHATGGGRVSGTPAATTGVPLAAVNPEWAAHKDRATAFVRQMQQLASDATARGRADVAARATAAAAATRSELTAAENRLQEAVPPAVPVGQPTTLPSFQPPAPGATRPWGTPGASPPLPGLGTPLPPPGRAPLNPDQL